MLEIRDWCKARAIDVEAAIYIQDELRKREKEMLDGSPLRDDQIDNGEFSEAEAKRRSPLNQG